jgi:DNA-binding LacI/PurR family transcriptional regulator
MTSFRFSTITEQVAAHLGRELRLGRWQGTMPGRNQLVKELGVSTRTIELAFQVLEKEGLLVPQGAGRRRKIVLPEGREGFGRLLDSLFGPTPPTALILDEPFLFHAAYHHLSGLGLRVPQDVSLVCTDPDPGFEWCRPPVAHIRWDYRPVVRRIQRWANNVARGKEDQRQSLTKAEFVDGGTVGKAP